MNKSVVVQKLRREDLFSLEQYAVHRPQFRKRIIAHKKHRQVAIGPHLTLSFEDHNTIQYQVQEMLRIEKIFEPDAIQEELDTYNPLIPDGRNWKATAMIEYENVEERRAALVQLRGIEDLVWVQIEGQEKIFCIANEDLPRSNAEKTSAVHFMRFELDADTISALQRGAAVTMGCDHPAYRHTNTLPDATRSSLVEDLAV
jgi:hypothetical protein